MMVVRVRDASRRGPDGPPPRDSARGQSQSAGRRVERRWTACLHPSAELLVIFMMQGFAGLSLFSVLLLMALGLAIIFGQMGVVNLAHGEFMALGAYMVYLCSSLVDERYAPALQPYYFIIAIIAFVTARLRMGWLVEWAADPAPLQTSARHAARDLGPELIMQQAFRSIFGARK
jgi:urea transport system permease protein